MVESCQKSRFPFINTPCKQKTVPKKREDVFLLEENPIIKVWILLLPKRGVKYMQKALLALLAWSGNHRLNIIKPCKMVSDLLVHLEAKWDVEMAIKMLWTPLAKMSTNDREQGTAAGEKLRGGTAIICQSSATAAGWVDLEWPGLLMPQLQELSLGSIPRNMPQRQLPKNPNVTHALDMGHPRWQRAHGTGVTHPKWQSTGGSLQGERCCAKHTKTADGVGLAVAFKTFLGVATKN